MEEKNADLFCKCIYLLLQMGVGLTLIILNIIIGLKTDFSFKNMKEFAKNSEQTLMYMDSLEIIPSNEKCPSGFEPISLGEWKGSKKGCFKEGLIFEGNCEGGKIIEATLPGKYEVYKGKKFCRKINMEKYESLLPTLSPNKCEHGEIDCGVIDLLEQHHCASRISLCPINYFKFSDSFPSELNGKNYKQVQFDEKTTLYYSNEMGSSGVILSQLVISDEIPCLDPELSVSKTKEWFELENYVKECEKDERFFSIPLDRIPKQTLHLDNKIRVPNYPYAKENSFLYASKYFGFKKEMRFEQKILSTKAFEKLNEKVNSLANNVKTGFFLAAISFIWQIIKPCIKKNDKEKEKKKESKGTNYEWIFYAIQIVSLICYFMAYSKISGISLNPDAYDWFSKTVIGPEIENVNYSRRVLLAILILNFIDVIFVLAACCCVCCGFLAMAAFKKTNEG